MGFRLQCVQTMGWFNLIFLKCFEQNGFSLWLNNHLQRSRLGQPGKEREPIFCTFCTVDHVRGTAIQGLRLVMGEDGCREEQFHNLQIGWNRAHKKYRVEGKKGSTLNEFIMLDRQGSKRFREILTKKSRAYQVHSQQRLKCRLSNMSWTNKKDTFILLLCSIPFLLFFPHKKSQSQDIETRVVRSLR